MLSLAEWLVLCVVCEEPRHGFAIARLLDTDGGLGRIWRVPKPVVYRAVQRLEQLGLALSADQQPSNQGPARSPVDATRAGRRLAAGWLDRPATHNRDVRSELLVKLALIDRAGGDPRKLIEAQRGTGTAWPRCCSHGDSAGWLLLAGVGGERPRGVVAAVRTTRGGPTAPLGLRRSR